MSQTITPTTSTWTAKVRTFLLSIVPSGTQVLLAPINRAAVPKDACVIMTPLFQRRLRTNLHNDVDPSTTLTGTTDTEMGTEQHVQVDFYGQSADDWCATTAMLWRDEYGCNMLNPECSPLYTMDARMVPLVTGEDQYFKRYSLTMVLQWNPVTVTPQEFFDVVDVTLIEVDSTYPP